MVDKPGRSAGAGRAVTYQMVEKVPAALLIVRGQAETVRRILILGGNSALLDGMIRCIMPFARALAASATVLHVMPPIPAMYADLYRREQSVEALLGSRDPLAQSLRRADDAEGPPAASAGGTSASFHQGAPGCG